MQSLREDMVKLVERIAAVAPEYNGDSDTHREICLRMAEEFELWSHDDKGMEYFPYWLSRVVAGVIADLGEGVTQP